MLTASHPYSLGIEVGPKEVSWARAVRGQSGIEIAAAARAPAMVGIDEHGSLTAMPSTGDPSLTSVTSGFVDLLGTSAAVMVSTTPYGPEALLACVLGAVRAANEAAVGSAAVAVTIVRGHDVDEFRAALLLEAVRLAGFSPDAARMVRADDAIVAAGRGPIPVADAAAIVALAQEPEDPATSLTSGVGLAGGAGAGALAGGGAATLDTAGAPQLIGNAPVSAAAPGPNSGTVPGPDGAAFGPPGSTAPPAGPGGATTVVGPTGSEAAGPAGSVAASTRPPWLPAAVAGVVVAVAIVAVVVLVLPSPGSEESAPVPVTETSVESIGGVASAAVGPVSSEGEPVVSVPPSEAPVAAEPEVETSTVPAPVGLDPASLVGTWQQDCAAESGTFYSVRYTVTQTGADQLTDITSTGLHQTSDCSDAPSLPTEEVHVWTVVGETVVDGKPTLQLTSDEGVNIRSIEGDTAFTAWAPPGSDFPTAFDPVLESTRL